MIQVFSHETISRLKKPSGVLRWKLCKTENKAFVLTLGNSSPTVQVEMNLSGQWVPITELSHWPSLLKYFQENKVKKITFENNKSAK